MIICFSGTGNSAAVAKELDRRLNHSACVVWVCPVHAWGLPRVVMGAIEKWPEIPVGFTATGDAPNDAPHWLVLTCGDDVGRAPDMWRRALSKRGLIAKNAFSIQMPNTYVNLPGFDVDTPSITAAKLKAMPARVADIAETIADGQPTDDVVPGKFPGFKTKLLYPFFNAVLMSPSRFKVSDKCTKCGLCAKTCPVENIEIGDNGPIFGGKCTTCMACYHVCPGKCINRPFTTKHGQYRFKSPQD